MVQLSVTRALAELKTIRKRLDKLIYNTTFISTKKTGQAWKDHIHETKSNWQAIGDLTNRYQQIKFVVIQSNATTKVTICDSEYTVAEAIAMKECLEKRKELLECLRQQRLSVSQTVDSHEQDVQRKLDNLLEINFKKDRKSDESDIKAISEAYVKNNRIDVVDPLGLDVEIKSLETEIENFLKEVDFTLSESNAVTKLNLV